MYYAGITLAILAIELCAVGVIAGAFYIYDRVTVK